MDEAQLDGLWHRIAGVMVQDMASRKFLLQKVAPNPYYNGGKWNITSTGHVDEGESYQEAALREMFEEMGVRGLELTEFAYYQTERAAFRAGKQRAYRRFNKLFLASADEGGLTIEPNPQEVEATAWMTWSDMQNVSKTMTLERFMQAYEDRDGV